MQPGQKPKSPTFFPLLILVFLFIITVGGCFHSPRYSIAQDHAPHYHIDINQVHNAVPRYLPKSKYGNQDYHVGGRWYHVLRTARGYDQRGIASWYGMKFQGHLTSTRDRYDVSKMTAASPVLPIPCYVRVTNLENGRQVIVKVNDRGPFAANRILDLSYVAAKKLGYENRGTALVEVTSIDMPNPLQRTRIQFAHHRPQLYLQVGAFTYPANAQRLTDSLRRVTRRNIRITHNGPHARFYRVQIGPLGDVSESDELQARIERAGLGHAITVIN